MKYKVIGFTNTEHKPKTTEYDLNFAIVLKEEFGLPHSLDDIAFIWKSYWGFMDISDFPFEDMKFRIEDAFGVILAPLGHKND